MLTPILNGFSLYEIVFFFAIYSFLGWCIEVAYAYTNRGYFVNRGFLYGPFCPIYGVGFVAIIVFLDKFKDNLIALYILSTLLTSIIEYVTGYLLEKIFKSKWWDYTEDPFNLHGRICLHFSLAWGLAAVAIIKIIHPIFYILVNVSAFNTGVYVFYILVSYFIIDLILTISSLIQFNIILTKLTFISGELKRRYSYIVSATKEKAMGTAQDMEDGFKELVDNYNNNLSKINFNHKRLMKAFPDMKSTSFNTIITELKEKISSIRDLIK
ncbi:putative ABC transporter permease [Clostridium sp. C8-1-8]|uniref:putative ABC transporter permease n=1 Tax=Clostridium sp. C8-1-8 TaxID=2698831 RepID=UPI00136BD711|nr:putative ABC transporter permease [Clostridium sp. C8-1-8]